MSNFNLSREGSVWPEGLTQILSNKKQTKQINILTTTIMHSPFISRFTKKKHLSVKLTGLQQHVQYTSLLEVTLYFWPRRKQSNVFILQSQHNESFGTENSTFVLQSALHQSAFNWILMGLIMCCHTCTGFGSAQILCSPTWFASNEANYLCTKTKPEYFHRKKTLRADLLKCATAFVPMSVEVREIIKCACVLKDNTNIIFPTHVNILSSSGPLLRKNWKAQSTSWTWNPMDERLWRRGQSAFASKCLSAFYL